MNNKTLVRLSNIIGISSIILLVYWVFIFISITVFGLKVFKQNISETFYLSVVGILALMFGALITNIMFNLTRIAEKQNADHISVRQTSKKLGILFGLSFPFILLLLFGGDYLTSGKKEKMLISSAKSIIESNHTNLNKLLNYSFDKKWISETESILDIYSKTDKNFPNVSVILADSIDKSKLFLGFGDHNYNVNDTVAPMKKEYIQITSEKEREYLNKVFYTNFNEVLFSASDGNYTLYYPYIKDGKRIVLYFSDYERYGKMGS